MYGVFAQRSRRRGSAARKHTDETVHSNNLTKSLDIGLGIPIIEHMNNPTATHHAAARQLLDLGRSPLRQEALDLLAALDEGDHDLLDAMAATFRSPELRGEFWDLLDAAGC